MAVLEIKHLTKVFKEVTPLQDLNLSVEAGSIFGFLGQNGAGKTTTLRIITGLAKATSGEVIIQNEKVVFGGGNTNRMVGFLPDVPEFYNFLTPSEYLRLCGKLYQMEPSVLNDRIPEVLAFVGLDGLKRNRRIQGFSRGMKQRLGIAQSLVHKPQLLLLDEPTSALDPVGRKEILDIIYSLKNELTVMFSTHILSDVERICDTVGVLHQGKLALHGATNSLRQHYKHQNITLGILEKDQLSYLQSLIEALDYVNQVTLDGNGLLHITSQSHVAFSKAIPEILATHHLSLNFFQTDEPSLEDIFMEVIGK